MGSRKQQPKEQVAAARSLRTASSENQRSLRAVPHKLGLPAATLPRPETNDDGAPIGLPSWNAREVLNKIHVAGGTVDDIHDERSANSQHWVCLIPSAARARLRWKCTFRKGVRDDVAQMTMMHFAAGTSAGVRVAMQRLSWPTAPPSEDNHMNITDDDNDDAPYVAGGAGAAGSGRAAQY